MKKAFKMLILIIGILVMLCSCSAGRGDRYINLMRGYAIDVVSSREVLVIYSSSDTAGNTIVIPCYFIAAYQLFEDTIILKGIRTQDNAISDDELEECDYSYFLIDTISNHISGPFLSHSELESFCASLEIKITNDWIQTGY
jgi:hypothetical protein